MTGLKAEIESVSEGVGMFDSVTCALALAASANCLRPCDAKQGA